MRRLGVLALIGLFLLPVGGGAVALEVDGARAVRVQELWADFYVKTGRGTFDWFILTARRELDLQTGAVLKQDVRVGLGTCEGPNPTAAACSGRIHPTRVERFTISEDFSRARVVVEDGRYEHRLSFTATGIVAHTPTNYDVECKPTADAFTQAWWARAKGTLYGHRFSTVREPSQSTPERMTESIFFENCL